MVTDDRLRTSHYNNLKMSEVEDLRSQQIDQAPGINTDINHSHPDWLHIQEIVAPMIWEKSREPCL